MNFETDVCIITEMWLQSDNDQINALLQDFQSWHGFALLRRDRQYQRGGGIGMLYDKTKIDLRTVKIARSEFEVMAAIGRTTGQRRKVLIIGVYVPPSYDVDTSERCLNFVNDTLVQLRGRYTNPYVIVAGDFNKRSIRRATRDFPDIQAICYGSHKKEETSLTL